MTSKKKNSAMSYTEGMRVESFQVEGSVHSPTIIKREPVPSEQENLANYVDLKEEQENQEEIQKEIFDVSLKYTRDPAFLGWLFNTFNFTRK